MTKKPNTVDEAVAEKIEEDQIEAAELLPSNPLAGAVRRMTLASIGAAALASDEFKNLVNKLIERGEIVENDGRKRLMEVIEHTQEQMRPAKTKTGDVPKYLPYADNVESVPADEEDDIRKVVQSIEQILQQGHEKSGKPLPDVHAKSHGCAKGEFRVLPNLPAELAQGLFRHPRTYDAVVRFSNSSGQMNPDAKPDGRGMAIKVIGVVGAKLLADEKNAKTQDFVMIDHPVFLVGTVEHYRRVEQVLADAGDKGFMQILGLALAGDADIPRHIAELIRAAAIGGHRAVNPVSMTYYSMAPIRFGQYVAKYRVEPVQDGDHALRPSLIKPGPADDALRLLLEETLRQQEVLFNFQVQLRTSEHTMPVEDTTVEWPESESPYRTVATFRILQQDIAPRREAGNNLSFTVWHAIADHRPLGGINRVRREAYRTSSVWRHQEAGKVRKEPNSITEIP
jgi:polyhydroxyalkanoate synthesis regulator phasin